MVFNVFMLCMYVQPVDIGHYCLPEDAEIHIIPTSKRIEQEFLNFLKHGTWKMPLDSQLKEDELDYDRSSNTGTILCDAFNAVTFS